MSPRPRKKGNKDLAGLSLYTKTINGVTYYQWRDPRNGRYHGFGTDKVQAVKDARALMTVIHHEVAARKLESIATSKQVPTLKQGVLIYWRVMDRARALKPNTRRSRSCSRKARLFSSVHSIACLQIR